MALAWAPVAIILLLLPGIFFFIGLASFERVSREIIRTTVVSEIAMAIVIAIAIHYLSISLLSTTGFRISAFVGPVAEYAKIPAAEFVQRVVDRLQPAILYLAATSALGFVFGWFVALGIVSGRLRTLARHKWIYDIIDVDRKKRIVTAFVLTTIVDEARIIMYKGRLHDIFLGENGVISYVILKNCSRYYMTFEEGKLVTSKPVELLGSKQSARPAHAWDRLLIDGKNIANILFDSSSEIKAEPEGERALNRALAEVLERLQRVESSERESHLRGSPTPRRPK